MPLNYNKLILQQIRYWIHFEFSTNCIKKLLNTIITALVRFLTFIFTSTLGIYWMDLLCFNPSTSVFLSDPDKNKS